MSVCFNRPLEAKLRLFFPYLDLDSLRWAFIIQQPGSRIPTIALDTMRGCRETDSGEKLGKSRVAQRLQTIPQVRVRGTWWLLPSKILDATRRAKDAHTSDKDANLEESWHKPVETYKSSQALTHWNREFENIQSWRKSRIRYLHFSCNYSKAVKMDGFVVLFQEDLLSS